MDHIPEVISISIYNYFFVVSRTACMKLGVNY